MEKDLNPCDLYRDLLNSHPTSTKTQTKTSGWKFLERYGWSKGTQIDLDLVLYVGQYASRSLLLFTFTLPS